MTVIYYLVVCGMVHMCCVLLLRLAATAVALPHKSEHHHTILQVICSAPRPQNWLGACCLSFAVVTSYEQPTLNHRRVCPVFALASQLIPPHPLVGMVTSVRGFAATQKNKKHMLPSSTALPVQRSYCFACARTRHPTLCKPRYVSQSYTAAEDPVVSTQWLAEHLEEVRHYCW
jgi:hypothetical protein